MLLVNWNLLPLPLLYLSAYFEKHRNDYYNLLLAVSERGAWHEWVMFFLRGVADQATDAIVRPKQLQDLQLEWHAELHKARVSGLALSIADLLFETPVVSAKDVADRFSVSHPAAMQALKRLEKMGILQEMSGRQRNRLYHAGDIFHVVE